MKYTYDRKTYLKPFYEGPISYYETAMFIDENEEIPLLFPIKKIISVNNYGLDEEYEEGKDYIVTPKGTLKLVPGTRIPHFKVEDYYLDNPNHKEVFLWHVKERSKYSFEGPKYLIYNEENFFTDYQIAVTYEHDGGYEGPKPICQGDKLTRFLTKLKNKEESTIVFFGDSITYGCNASGTKEGGFVKPNAPSWPQMVTEELRERFDTKINYVNTAVGGTISQWGADNVKELVCDKNPDLVVLAFGMNDGFHPLPVHFENMKKIISTIKENNPNSDIILVTTTVPNPETNWYGNQFAYGTTYKAFKDCAIADMTNMHRYLITKKNFKDMTGNNINHPNDYLIRVYAQMVLGTIIDIK